MVGGGFGERQRDSRVFVRSGPIELECRFQSRFIRVLSCSLVNVGNIVVDPTNPISDGETWRRVADNAEFRRVIRETVRACCSRTRAYMTFAGDPSRGHSSQAGGDGGFGVRDHEADQNSREADGEGDRDVLHSTPAPSPTH